MYSFPINIENYYLIPFIADILIWLMFAGLASLWLIDGKIKREQALHAFLAAVIAWTITEFIKNIFPTLRPYQLNGQPTFTLALPLDSSFPSGHTAAAFAIATGVWLHNKKTGFWFIIAAILVALGRVFSNVHSYIDIYAGSFIGIASGHLLQRLHVTRLLK